MIEDIKLCLSALAAKNSMISQLFRYYEGDHPVIFTNPKWNEVFQNTVPWNENLCQLVCDTPAARLRIQSWNSTDDTAREALEAIWKRALRKTAAPVHKSTLVCGEAYIVAWPGADGKARAYYHDPRQAVVLYEDDDPDAPRVACKAWVTGKGEAKRAWLNLYYADRLEHYCAKGENPDAKAYLPTVDGDAHIEANPFGTIPVFHFRLATDSDRGVLTRGILKQQDALNKLLNDMMVSSEYSAFAQRWAIGNFDDASKIPVGPGITTKFPSAAAGEQSTEVGAFPTTPPGNYLEPMDHCRSVISALSATPKHFLDKQGGNPPSGEALTAMEAPLIERVLAYEECLATTWAEVGAFCLKVEKVTVSAEEIEILWADPHTQQPESEARTMLILTQAGVPVENQLRDKGWTEEDIDGMHDDANVAATIATVPNLTKLPKATTPEGRAAVMDKAATALTDKTAPGVGQTLSAATSAGVDKMTENGALAATLAKNAGRKVRK